MGPSEHNNVNKLQYRLKSYAHRTRVSRGGRAGNARGLPVRPPREERTKHETKSRRNLGNHAFFKGRVFVLLIAFVYFSLVFYCSVLATIPKRCLSETLTNKRSNRNKKLSRTNSSENKHLLSASHRRLKIHEA